MGQDGFENETLLMEALNNKRFNELNKNLKDVITFTSEKPINEKYADTRHCLKLS